MAMGRSWPFSVSLVWISARLRRQRNRIRVDSADRAFSALQHNDYGQYDTLIDALAPALCVEGLNHLKMLFVEWSKQVER